MFICWCKDSPAIIVAAASTVRKIRKLFQIYFFWGGDSTTNGVRSRKRKNLQSLGSINKLYNEPNSHSR
jgi:hypothetical protein